MVLLEQYVTLYENRWKNVFAGWKILQILIYFLTALVGIIATFGLSKVLIAFEGKCLLFSNVTLIKVEHGGETDIDINNSDWGNISYCLFCQYVPVCSVIFAAVWLAFFVMCGRGGRSEHGLPQPWRIVYPAMFFNIIYFLISMLAVVWYETGYNQFCTTFAENINQTEYIYLYYIFITIGVIRSMCSMFSCDDLRKYKLSETTGEDTRRYLYVTKVCLWLNMVGWFLGALLLVLRCCFLADFTVMKITIVAATPEEEEAPKAIPESSQLSPEENQGATLNIPPVL